MQNKSFSQLCKIKATRINNSKRRLILKYSSCTVNIVKMAYAVQVQSKSQNYLTWKLTTDCQTHAKLKFQVIMQIKTPGNYTY